MIGRHFWIFTRPDRSPKPRTPRNFNDSLSEPETASRRNGVSSGVTVTTRWTPKRCPVSSKQQVRSEGKVRERETKKEKIRKVRRPKKGALARPQEFRFRIHLFDQLLSCMPSEVFHCCDTNGNGQLDLHEVKFALNAFGLFPSLDYLRPFRRNTRLERITSLEVEDHSSHG